MLQVAREVLGFPRIGFVSLCIVGFGCLDRLRVWALVHKAARLMFTGHGRWCEG